MIMIVIAACRRFLLLPIEEKNSYRSLLSDLLSLSRDYPLGGTNVLFECFLFFPFSLRHLFRHLFRPEIHDIVNVICVSFRNRVGTESIFRPSLLSIGSIVKRVANEERRETWVLFAGTCRNSGGRGQRYTRRVRLRHLVATWVSLLSSGVVPKTFPFCTAST